MIKENQRLLNQFNVITDGVSVFFTLLLAFWVRFFLLPGGEISVPFSHYVYLGLALVPIHLFTYASFSLYESFRKKRLYQELGRLCTANVLDMALLQTFLFMFKEVHFSRWTLIFFFLLNTALLGTKRFFLRYLLRHYRQKGYNLKHVLIVGAGPMARRYLDKIRADKSWATIRWAMSPTDRAGRAWTGRAGTPIWTVSWSGTVRTRWCPPSPRKNSARPHYHLRLVKKGGRQALHDPVLRRIYA